MGTSMRVAVLVLLSTWLIACDSGDDARTLVGLVSGERFDSIEISSDLNPIVNGEVDPNRVIVSQGSSTKLNLIASDGGMQKDVSGAFGTTWTSADVAVATVSSTGLVTGVADGTVEIVGTFGNLSEKKSITVFSAQAGSISIESEVDLGVALNECSSVPLTAAADFGDFTLDVTNTANWRLVSGSEFVSLNGGSLTTLAGDGDAELELTYSGQTITQSVSVLDNLAAIALSTDNGIDSELLAGGAYQFTATGTFNDGTTDDITENAVWNIQDSEPADFASLNNSTKGLIATSSCGTANLVVGCGGQSAIQSLTVSGSGDFIQNYFARRGQRLDSPYEIIFDEAKTIQLGAIASFACAQVDITEDSEWSIDPADDANFSLDNDDGSKGELTIRGIGKFTITITHTDDDDARRTLQLRVEVK